MYKVITKHCVLEDRGIAKVYFINEMPFTFDELEDHQIDENVLEESIMNPTLTVESIGVKSDYLIREEIHPLLCSINLHPESTLPDMLK